MEQDALTNKKVLLAIFLSAILLFVVFTAGIFIGYEQRPAVERVKNVIYKETEKPAEVDFSLFWDVWSRLKEKYVEREKIDAQKQVWGAIGGMVKSLGDPHTVFLPPEDHKQFQQDLKGEFGGIGAELSIKKGLLTVITPLKGSPAEKAGLKPGDKILKIEDKITADLTLEEAVHLIRGEKGTPVKLTILNSSDETKEVTIVRDTIVIPTIETKSLGNGIFYIHLMSFNEASPRIFRDAVAEFLNSENDKLIFDLRGNAGGFLNAAVDIASWFIPAGELVALERFADGTDEKYRSIGRKFLENVPTVLLMNQGSASASEILAGALRDMRNIKIVGEKSFGKGSVQELISLDEGASLKVTIAKWLTPKEIAIDGVGLEPDIKVEMKKEDIDAGKDPQLDKAIEVLKAL